jgi:L-amino acid N-acyltransferase YncA
MKIRFAEEKDIHPINQIYNQSIPSKSSTAHLLPVSIEERVEWFKQHNTSQYPVFVAVENNVVIAWISLSPYRSGRQALRYTAEVSYYVHKDHQRKGIASSLMEYVIENCKKFTIKTLIAILMAHNINSIHLLKKFKFEEWGRLQKVLDIDGNEFDHLYYGLRVHD